MKATTLKALEGSIQKWASIVKGSGSDHGTTNCPLCELFYHNGCDGCPVKEKTKHASCDNTPYEDWLDGRRVFLGPLRARTKKQKLAAKAELKFLRALRPRKRKRKRK